MDKGTEQNTKIQLEDKTSLESKKIWDLESKTLKVIYQPNVGSNRKEMLRVKNGQTFISVDPTGKRYVYGKFNNRIYNLTTGDEV